MSNRCIRLPKVLDIVGGSRSWVYQQISEGKFPKPILLGKRSVVWIEQEIYDFLDQRIKESRQSPQLNGVKQHE